MSEDHRERYIAFVQNAPNCNGSGVVWLQERVGDISRAFPCRGCPTCVPLVTTTVDLTDAKES